MEYKELGSDHLDNRKKDKLAKRYIKRLSELGFDMEIKKAA